MNVQDFQATGDLDASNPMVMDSSKLRFPQMIPTETKETVTFNRQIRKNIITNVIKTGQYNIGGRTMTGAQVQQMFGEAIALLLCIDFIVSSLLRPIRARKRRPRAKHIHVPKSANVSLLRKANNM